MSVPSHDERDFDFAKAHSLPIIAVFDPDLITYAKLIPEGVNPEAHRQAILKGEVCWTGEGKSINSSSKTLSIIHHILPFLQ